MLKLLSFKSHCQVEEKYKSQTGKIFAEHISDARFAPEIYKILLQPDNKKTGRQLLNGQSIWILYQGRYASG